MPYNAVQKSRNVTVYGRSYNRVTQTKTTHEPTQQRQNVTRQFSQHETPNGEDMNRAI